ncbi:MAG: hypothetical protein Q8K35_04365 [Thiobacillus sp.]|nr:hypothetical protein [Thiobacillus sp.]
MKQVDVMQRTGWTGNSDKCRQASMYAAACSTLPGMPGLPHSTVTAGHNPAKAADCTPRGRMK